MGRQPKKNRADVKTVVIGVKMSPAERDALARLVEIRSAEIEELTGDPITATASAVLRWLLVKEAKSRGIPIGASESKPPPASEPPARARPAAKAPTPKASAPKAKAGKGRGR